MQTERPTPRIIVGAAIIEDGRVLACARSEPPEFAGRWEFPGGKVEPGESEIEALVRECAEELGVTVDVGERVGADVPLGARLGGPAGVRGPARQRWPYRSCSSTRDMRWLAADELDSVDWLPADAPIVAALPAVAPALSPARPRQQKQRNCTAGAVR